MTNHIEILDFWFIQHGMEDWFYASDEFDARIKTNFNQLHAQAIVGEFFPGALLRKVDWLRY